MGRSSALALGAAIALAVAATVVAAFAWSSLPLPLLPESVPFGDFGIAWSDRALEPDPARRFAIRELLQALAVTTAGAAAIAIGTFALLMAGSAVRRRRELATRAALGADVRRTVRELLRDALPACAGGAGAGVAAAVGGLLIAGATWPGAEGEPLPGTALGLALVTAVALLLFVAVPVTLLPARYTRAPLAALLATGERATRDRHEGSALRLAVGGQMALALALLAGALLAAGAGASGASGTEGLAAGGEDVLIVPLEPIGEGASALARDWDADAFALAEEAGAAAEAVASPGAWVGVGTVDFTLADCGGCVLGTMVLPFVGRRVHHHAVSPGFFDTAGLAVLDGRAFAETDAAGAPLVAIVSRTFAVANFERGRPVGRLVRLGARASAWYRIVGVVEDPATPALGRGIPERGAVYVASLQHPPARVEIALRGAESADLPALDAAAAARGLRVAGPPRTLADRRSAELAPVRWWGRVQAAAALAAFVLAIVGVHEMARMDSAARRRELALRAALGAPRARLVRDVLARVATTAAAACALAVPAAVGVTAAVQHVAVGVPVFDPLVHLALSAALTAAALVGALGPAWRATRVHPAEAMLSEP